MTPPSTWVQALRHWGDLNCHSLVCEVGCGTGERGEAIYTECRHWFGVEAEGEALQAAELRLGGRPRISFVELQRPHPLDLPDGGVDLVCSSLEASAWDGALFRECRRVLQPDGRFLWLPAAAPDEPDTWCRRLQDAGFTDVGWQRINDVEPPVLTARCSDQIGHVPPSPLRQDTSHREGGYAHLHGAGLEIGALDAPAVLGPDCQVRYFDAIDAVTARRLFPEADPERFVAVDYLGDVDQDGLAPFADGTFAFVICNHVLEHVANPIKVVRALFRIVRAGGHVVIAIPDKRYTFDHERPLTPYEHLWREFEADVREVSDDHYREFIRYVVPHVLSESPQNQALHLQRCRERREHAHAWDSPHFHAFMQETLRRLGICATCVFASRGEENRIEYFSVWQKQEP